MSDDSIIVAERTLFLFHEVNGDLDDGVFFFELEGDYSRFDGIFINTSSPKRDKKSIAKHNALTGDLVQLVYQDAPPYYKITKLKAPTRDWRWFVSCGNII